MKVVTSSKADVTIRTNAMPSGILLRQEHINEVREGLERSGLISLTQAEVDDLQGLAFRYLFKLDEKLLNEMELSRKTLGLGSSYVALHLRTGFVGASYTENLTNWDRTSSEWESAFQCALNTADKYFGNNSLVFLATDSDEVKDFGISKYGNRIRTLRNPIVHINRVSLNRNRQKEDEKKGVLTVWVEHLLLAQAEFLVHGRSGLAWTAGQLCSLFGNNRTRSIHHKCTIRQFYYQLF